MTREFLAISLVTTVLAITITNCSAPQSDSDLSPVVEDYIRTYQKRKDWTKFLSFYSDSVYMKDVNLGLEFQGKDAFKTFYDWPNPNFKKLNDNQRNFTVEDVVVYQDKAIIRGYFNPFYWKGEIQNWAGPFIIWLYFDETHKIIQQYDYVKYPARFLE